MILPADRPVQRMSHPPGGSPGENPDLWLGTVHFSPTGPIVAGSLGTYTFVYRVGRFGVDNGGTIKVAIRLASDWGRPQLDRPDGEGYTTVRTTGRARLRVHFDRRGFVRPFGHTLAIEVFDEALAEGDEVIVVWGDTSQGGPGSRAQTFVDRAFEFRFLVDCFGTQQFRRVPSSPVVEVIAGPIARFLLVAPSTARVGDELSGILRAEDAFGNPVGEYDLPGSVSATGQAGEVASASPLAPGQAGAPSHLATEGTFTRAPGQPDRWTGVRLPSPGVYTLIAQAADGSAVARSNPILVTAEAPRWRLWWGDTQGQSGATVGTGDLDSFFRYARDVAALDFVVHSANDFQITDALYQATRDAVIRYHDPGTFVTFLSYEWSGNTPAGGDHNIIFLYDDDAPLHRSSQWQLPNGKDDGTDRYPISTLWETLRGRTDVIAVPHVGGRYANFDFLDPAFCPVIEVASVHGRFNWFAEEALARGLRVGFVAATDDHSGRPGASAPTAQPDFGHFGGLAGVYASANTREALWEALRARRCFGTTGPRIHLWTEMDGQPMGGECVVEGSPVLRVRAVGTAPIETIEILRGVEVARRVVLRPPAGPAGRRLRIAWSGARLRGRGRAARWDGGLRLEHGTIRSALEWGFETPGQGIWYRSEREVRWRSTTAGDPDGVELEVDAAPDAAITFETGPATFSLPLSKVQSDPFVFLAGEVEQRVEVAWVGVTPGPAAIDLEWADESAPAGTHPYWVRLLQSDTHAAWSSPIFATVVART